MDKLHNLILPTSSYLWHDTTSIWIKYVDNLHNLIVPTSPYLRHDTTWSKINLIDFRFDLERNKKHLAAVSKRIIYIHTCQCTIKLCKCLGCSGWNFFIWSLKFFLPRISSKKFKLAVAKIQIRWNMSYIMRQYRSSSIKDPASILSQCGENAKGLKFLLKKLV